MKLVTDDGLEIPIKQIKVIQPTSKDRIIVNIKNQNFDKEQMKNMDHLWENLRKFFKPAKVMIFLGDVEIGIKD